MNSTQLLNQFDRVSEAPDAIPRLRRFILDLAVRGKLVEQDSNEKPESAQRDADQSLARPAPFQVPRSWTWARVGDIADCRLGKMLDKVKNRGTPHRYLRNVNVRWFDFDLSDTFEMPFEESELDEFRLRRGDVLVCEGGEPGRAAVWDERQADIYFQKAVHRVRLSSVIDSHFFVNVLRQSADSGTLAAYFTGVGIKHLTGRGLASFAFPLPPLSEQHRIVAKVNDLMALCGRLEAARTERERRRDRLSAASLNRLNQPDELSAFREHVRFHLDHLPRLANQQRHIEHLRETILNLAVHGRLVEQDERDEPSSEVLARIAKEKKWLLREGTIKRERRLAPVGDDADATLVPCGWRVVRAGDVLTFVTSGSRGWAEHYAEEGSIFLRIGNLDYGTTNLDLSDIQHVRPPSGAEGTRTLVQEGDILISITGDTGMVGLVPAGMPAAYINQHIGLARPSSHIFGRYLAMFFTSPVALAALRRFQRGIKNSLGLDDIRNVGVLLPPVAEQHRIVAKVDELMAVCDRLEAQMAIAVAENRRLLEAVLHDAAASPSDMGPTVGVAIASA